MSAFQLPSKILTNSKGGGIRLVGIKQFPRNFLLLYFFNYKNNIFSVEKIENINKQFKLKM